MNLFIICVIHILLMYSLNVRKLNIIYLINFVKVSQLPTNGWSNFYERQTFIQIKSDSIKISWKPYDLKEDRPKNSLNSYLSLQEMKLSKSLFSLKIIIYELSLSSIHRYNENSQRHNNLIQYIVFISICYAIIWIK
jgi:hypothetical protein